LNGSPEQHEQKFIGEAIDNREGEILVEVKNKFQIGDNIIFMSPNGDIRAKLVSMTDNMAAK